MTRDFSKVPATVTIKNAGEMNATFRYFRVNFVEVIKPEDEVVITVASSEELAYYASLANETAGIAVEIAAAE